MNRLATAIPAMLLLAACVTINVYFPEASAMQAADRIIEEVRGASEAEDDESTTLYQRQKPSGVRMVLHSLGEMIEPSAHAQADFDATSSAKRALEASLKKRFALLEPYYNSGAVGLTTQATIEIRDRGSIPLKDRNTVRQLVAEQNADWEALYAEIARINEHPEWLDRIRSVFAQRWIAKAKSGWHYRDDDGVWQRK